MIVSPVFRDSARGAVGGSSDSRESLHSQISTRLYEIHEEGGERGHDDETTRLMDRLALAHRVENWDMIRYLEARLREARRDCGGGDKIVEYLLKISPILMKLAHDDGAAGTAAPQPTHGLNAFVQRTKVSRRGEISEMYAREMGQERRGTDSVVENCPSCGSNRSVLSEGELVCTDCATCYPSRTNAPGSYHWEKERELMGPYAYKRINHFNEILAQKQGKEDVDIPVDVINAVKREVRKVRIRRKSEVTVERIIAILKKLKLTTWYEHAASIVHTITGVPPPRMSPDLEEKLKAMFQSIQAPFKDITDGTTRRNFLSYSYVFHKLLQLLEHDEFLHMFPLLKSRDKLHNQDIIWKQICERMSWRFYKSV